MCHSIPCAEARVQLLQLLHQLRTSPDVAELPAALQHPLLCHQVVQVGSSGQCQHSALVPGLSNRLEGHALLLGHLQLLEELGMDDACTSIVHTEVSMQLSLVCTLMCSCPWYAP